MREIEVKALLKDPKEIFNKLENLGCVFSYSLNQKDRIFLANGTEFSDIKNGTNILRIREQNGKTIFTLKRREEDELNCIEKEVSVENGEEMGKILEYLGFHEVLIINKTRKKCKYNGWEICIDFVNGLGDFIEIEKMSDEEGIKVQSELMEFLISLGVKKEDRVFKGYDTLLMEKK